MADRPPTFDHLRKKPLEERVRVYLDDDTIDRLTDARAELAQAEHDADETYQRRMVLARAANPPAAELLTIDDGLWREREASVASSRDTVAAAEEAVRDASHEFVFRSPGRKAFEDLIAEHPPTETDHDDVRRKTGRPESMARWHGETFIPALLAATCIDPKLTVEQAQQMCDDWTDGEVDPLVNAALLVATGVRQVDLGKASRAAVRRG